MVNSVLVIDDSKAMRLQLIRYLREASLFERYFEAGDGLEGFRILTENRIDLVFCDLVMPKMDGFRFMSLMKTHGDFKDIPLIMLTGQEDRDSKIKGLEHGASDFLTKPFDAGELIARAKVHLKIKALQDELKWANEQLRELSITDPLTRLYNRRHLMEILGTEFSRIERTGGCLALLIMDIDHFKLVNDTYGHHTGDMVLKSLAESTMALLRPYDTAVRFGGEEFMMVLPETDLAEGITIAERLRAAAEKIRVPASQGNIAITVSLGVSHYPSSSVDSIDRLIEMADSALYRAKAEGRNQVRSSEENPD